MTGKEGKGLKLKDRFLQLLRTSIILALLDRFSSFIYRQLSESFIGRMFSAYEKEERKYRGGFFASAFLKDRKSKLLTKLRYLVARAFEENSFLGFLGVCRNYFLGCRLKVYGLFTLSFGIYTALIYIFKRYAFYLENSSVDHLYFGIGAIVISLLLIPSGQILSEALLSSRIMRCLLISALGIRPEDIACPKAKRGGSGTLFFIGGILVGLATYAVSPIYVILFILGLVVLDMIFSYPEAGVIIMIFVSPFIVFLPHPSLFLAGMMLVVSLSYLIKLIRGKRTFKLELADLFVLLFAVLVLFGGIVSVAPSASLKPALIFVCLMLGYFLVVNLMRTKLWLSRTIAALTGSAFLVSVYGIFQYFTGAANENWIDPALFEDISGRAISTFENPNMLAEYLILILPFVLAMFLYTKNTGMKAVYLLSFASCILCVVYTWSRSAWLGAIAGLVLFFLLYSKKTLYLLFVALAALPIANFILPQTVLDRFYSIGNLADSSNLYRVYLWKSVGRMISDFFGGGIGIGEGAFTSLYPMYTYAGMEASPHSHSIYLQIILELGVAGIVIFLAVMFLLSQGVFEYSKRSTDARSKLMSCAALCGVFSALIQGAADYIWYNYRVFFIFWIVAGIMCAYRRIGYEDENEMRIQNDEGCAVIDIPLSKKI